MLVQCPSSLPLGVLQTSCLLILEFHQKQLKQILATWGRSHQQGNINNPKQFHYWNSAVLVANGVPSCHLKYTQQLLISQEY